MEDQNRKSDIAPEKPPRKPKIKTISQLNLPPVDTQDNNNEKKPTPARRTVIFQPGELQKDSIPIPKPRTSKSQSSTDIVTSSKMTDFFSEENVRKKHDPGSNKLQRSRDRIKRRITSVVNYSSVEDKKEPNHSNRHSIHVSPTGK